MAFKASFKFSDSREFDVLTWRVKFNRDVDPKGRPASDIYGGTIYVEVESTPDTIVLDKMFKQYQPVNGNIVFKKADEDAKMKELVFENGYVVDYEEALNVANQYPMTIKFAISAQTVKMDEATFVQDCRKTTNGCFLIKVLRCRNIPIPVISAPKNIPTSRIIYLKS